MPVHVRYTSSIPPYIYVILREEPNGPHSLNNSSSNKTVFHLLENDFIRCSSCQSRRLPLNVKKNGKFMGISFSSLMTGIQRSIMKVEGKREYCFVIATIFCNRNFSLRSQLAAEQSRCFKLEVAEVRQKIKTHLKINWNSSTVREPLRLTKPPPI
ncbi:unnamed protein product [Brassica rapa subsp. trilocularis]